MCPSKCVSPKQKTPTLQWKNHTYAATSSQRSLWRPSRTANKSKKGRCPWTVTFEAGRENLQKKNGQTQCGSRICLRQAVGMILQACWLDLLGFTRKTKCTMHLSRQSTLVPSIASQQHKNAQSTCTDHSTPAAVCQKFWRQHFFHAVHTSVRKWLSLYKRSAECKKQNSYLAWSNRPKAIDSKLKREIIDKAWQCNREFSQNEASTELEKSSSSLLGSWKSWRCEAKTCKNKQLLCWAQKSASFLVSWHYSINPAGVQANTMSWVPVRPWSLWKLLRGGGPSTNAFLQAPYWISNSDLVNSERGVFGSSAVLPPTSLQYEHHSPYL